MLDGKDFKESLRGEYRDDIQMIIRECHDDFTTFLDVKLLNKKLSLLHSNKDIEKLDEDDWLDLVFELCPDIYDHLDFGPMAA